jgi:enoyl-CoA hydratase/carnithine racemase
MTYTTIAVEKRDRIGLLFLNRPQVLNALSEEMSRELLHYLAVAAAAESVAFCFRYL